MSAVGTRGAGYGLDAELAKKQAAKHDPAREAACLQWIEAVIGEKVDSGPFGQVLKNGQLLVKLINKIKAGSVKKMETSGLAFKQMENISNFLRACRAVGVEEYEVFETVDLFEEKDLNVVVDCLYSLSRTAQKKVPDFKGPYLDNADSAPPVVSVFDCTKATQSLALGSTTAATTSSKPSSAPPPPPPKPSTSISTAKTYTNAKPSITPTLPANSKASPSSSTVPVNSSGTTVPTGTRGAGYGLDADLAKKQAAKHNSSAEQEAIVWIEAVTGQAPLVSAGESLASALKSGEVLCNLVNKIKADSVKRVNNSKMPFKQMENISAFLKACRALGVMEHDLFETVDLYEEKDMNTVVLCIFALGRTIQVSVPEYTGPALGPRMAHENKRTFTEGQLAHGREMSGMTKLAAGSSSTMERTHISSVGTNTFGANASK